ncbi:hypothetical protein GCK32_020155 [Trichostrongylus colubriformis]|uniref:Uncharacterized protein n=1 Tax=Trichostrongylus colubriformis TaxID=6319 RepID=A0AAN8G245_TRICO
MLVNLLLLVLLLSYTTSGDLRNGNKSLKEKRTANFEKDPCLDAQQVEDVTSVKFLPRYAAISRPWLRSNVAAKVYKSNGLLNHWRWVKSLPIKGLKNENTVSLQNLP